MSHRHCPIREPCWVSLAVTLKPLASIEELFERYGVSDDPKLQQVVAHAMNMKGAGHGHLG